MSSQREMELDHKDEQVAIDQTHGSDADVLEEKLAHLDAQLQREKTVSQALKDSKRLMPYFIYGIWTIVCCSFDNSAGIVVLGIPQFRKDFGYAFQGGYVLPADWQSAFSGGPQAAQILATFFAGYVGDKIGRKKMCWIAYALLMVGITLEFISSETSSPRELFFSGKFINGLGIGILLTTGYTYVTEIAPVMLRGIFIAAASEAFCIGTFTLALIVNAYGGRTDAWAYRSAFVTQYFVTGFGIIFLPFIPESPMWLVLKGRTADAVKAQRRLGATEEEASRRIANHSYTLRKAAQESAGATYAELFKGTNRRRTMVAATPLTFQSFSGVVWVIGYFVYYAQLAGYSTEMSFKLNITQQVLSLSGNICSWFVIERLGRRLLTLMGIIGLTVLLLAAGIAATIGGLHANRATISFVLCTCFYWNFTLGATSKVAMAEIGTSRLRNKTAGFGVAMQGTLATFWNFVLPYMFNPNAGNLQGKCAFVFGGTSLLCCVYTYFCHPETKGRSFEEMDELFMKKVPARQFRKYVTEAEVRSREVKEEVQAKGQVADDETV